MPLEAHLHNSIHNKQVPRRLSACRFVADETDGRFARQYNQTSTLGAVLDMVTDRYVVLCLHLDSSTIVLSG